ncbi:TonB-dependent receptor [Pseudorhodoferax sp.]|uniref:TonB-dependent receptor n=1 Tax=Pseudorhodoferax sp. TaxID=1993553 RepID=UPI0039E261DE
MQPIQDTPFSIVTVDEEGIREADARFLTEALRDDPSVLSSSGAAASYGTIQQIQIRGFGLAYNTNYKLNGLSVIRFGETAMEGVGRIDVLKGLSGFAYGFSSPGGIVNFVSKKPTEQPYRAVTLGYTSQSLLRAQADLGGRFGADDRFGYRVNLAKEHGDTPIDAVKLDRTVASGYFDWRVTPDLTVAMNLERHEIDRTGQPFSYSLASGVPVPAAPSGSRFNGVDYAGYDSRETLAGLSADWKLGADWSLSAGLLKQWFSRDAYFSLATINNARGDFTGSTQRDALQDFPSWAAQVSLQGRVQTGSLLHELSMGLDWHATRSYRGDYAFSSRWTSNLYDPVPAPASDLYAVRGKYQNAFYRERGLYLTDTLHLNERWRLIGGLRYGRISSGNLGATGAAAPAYQSSATTPMVAIVFKPVEGTTLYASYAEGLEQGGTAPTNTGNAGTVFGALKSQQIEVGLKWQPTAAWSLTAAAYRIDKGLGYTDTATNLYTQNGSQVHQGLEFTADGMLTRNLRLVSGLSLIDATMERTGNAAVEGGRPTGVPRQVFTAMLDYEPAFLQDVGLDAGYRWTGDRAQDATNTRFLPGYGLFDAGARYRTRINGAPAVLRAHVDNLLNKRYWDAGLYPGMPRTFKLTFELTL